MNLLDALLAFAVTMALLGTVVTMIIEVGHRFFRVRKGNLIAVLKLLSHEIDRGVFRAIGERGKWDFIASVLNNPARPRGKLPQSQDMTIADARMHLPTVLGQWTQKITFKPVSTDAGEDVDWNKAIAALGRVNAMRGVFEKVSLEHILRRLSELDPVRDEIGAAFETAEQEFNRLSRKYMELASAVSADFKRRSQMWSMVVGVLLAYACNINGLMVFQAYLQDSDMRAQVIARLDAVGQEVKRTRENLEQAADGEENGATADVHKSLTDIDTTLSSLGALPIGTAYFPHNWIIAKWRAPGSDVTKEKTDKTGKETTSENTAKKDGGRC